MTRASDVARLVRGQKELVRLAQNDMRRFLRAVDPSSEFFQAGLDEVFINISTRYGNVGASAAAEWYEGVRAQQGYSAVLAAGDDVSTMVKASRYAVRNGVTPESEKFLMSMLQTSVLQAARNTISLNVGRDPSRPRFARVPIGRTCAFCVMLGSRGFVYWSAESAGDFTKYHNDCDCAIVPGWGDNPTLAGYDPDKYRAEYEAGRTVAQEEGKRATTKNVLSGMREEFDLA